MELLIQWKDTQERVLQKFGVLDEGQISPNAQQMEDDDDVFFWLTADEARHIGAGFDGGDFIVVSPEEDNERTINDIKRELEEGAVNSHL